MANVSRRKLLVGAGASAATLGVLATIPAIAAKIEDKPQLNAASAGPLMAYVVDPTKDDVILLVGGKEITFKDHAFVTRLLQAGK